MHQFYQTCKAVLARIGLLPAARSIRERLSPDLRRRRRMHRALYLQYRRKYHDVLGHRLYAPDRKKKIALVCSIHFPEVYIELAIIKALELAGFEPVVLTSNTKWLLPKYYALAGIDRTWSWNDFTDPLDLQSAETLIEGMTSIQQLLDLEYDGARVGRHAISTAFRKYRVGAFDLNSTKDRRRLTEQVAASIAYTKASRKLLEKFSPALLVCTDKGYSPKGELFDLCLEQGIDAISWDFGHKRNSLILKRFTFENRDQHNNTLSPELWRFARDMSWTGTERDRLRSEWHECYASGEWYSIAGTQVNKRFMDKEDIRKQLGLDPQKKTAVIFPHILWDATLFWGRSLFSDYEEWLIETVRAACSNDQVNWILKIHPAHVGKGLREGFKGEPAEAIAIRKHIGQLPPHVYMIPADSDMSTISLYELMDYCITVRGSVGIEAAMLGIPALTAGEGSYDNKGFTIDSESREQFLDRVANIHETPLLTPAQQELAQRFAYAYFILRVLRLTSVGIEYHDSQQRHLAKGTVNVKDKDGWMNAADTRVLAEWINNNEELEFWMRGPSPNEIEEVPIEHCLAR